MGTIQIPSYDYLELDPSVPLQSTRYLMEGVQGIRRRNDALFRPRRAALAQLDDDGLVELIQREALERAPDGVGGDDCDAVLLGDRPLSVFRYMTQRDACAHVLRALRTRVRDQPLERGILLGILSAHEAAPPRTPLPELEVGGAGFPDAREADPFPDPTIVPDFTPNPLAELLASEYVDCLTGTLDQVLRWGYFIEAASETLRAFEELLVRQARDERAEATIRWNIRSDAQIFIDEPWEAMRTAGRIALRAPSLLRYERRSSRDPRRAFDAYRVSAAKDEFRYHYARVVGVLDEQKATAAFPGDLEVRSFDAQYRTLSPREQRLFSRLSKDLLTGIAHRYHLPLPARF